MAASCRILASLTFVTAIFAADLEISRPVRSWEFLDALGPKAGILGREDGVLEAYVYPLKVFKDLHLVFRIDGRTIPGESIARRIVSRPGSYTIVYSGDEYEVRETLAASSDQPGAVIRLQIHSYAPLRVDVEFTRDFQLMWPASIGTAYGEWNDKEKVWQFGADGQPFAAVLGSPDGALVEHEYLTNYSTDASDRFTLGTIKGNADRYLILAGSVRSRDEALATYHTLLANPAQQIAAAEKRYLDYLGRTVKVQLPDEQLQRAYDWAKLSEAEGLVENPLLGNGLVAGYGPSKGVYRPGFAWFFGRDTFWTTFALTSAGDLDLARTGIDFIAKYQREDGKIPHEISQSASLVPWFQGFPYAYASGDATPLYVIAARNFVQASGDVEFARKHWPKLQKAFEYMHANLETNGFLKNFGNGHGWVEGGPLLPVQVEFYQAGCYVEAVRSMATLARLTGQSDVATQMDQEFQTKQRSLSDRFWLAQERVYAFAINNANVAVNQPSVLATVPMWFGLTDPDHSLDMIRRLSEEEHAADWGMRILSSKSPTYSPEGYHYGSVWPLFTGWASVGEYRYHAATPAYANLRANAWLALDGAGGNPTEVLSGMSYSPLSTASPHQIWSAAMIVSPLLRGLLGLHVDMTQPQITFAPHLPYDWPTVGVTDVPFGSGKINLSIKRDEQTMEFKVVGLTTQPTHIEFEPAYPPSARIMTAELDGTPIKWTEDHTQLDWHPHFAIDATPGPHTLRITHQGMFGYSVPFDPPQLGATSSNLKIVSEAWSQDNSTLNLVLTGRGSRSYKLPLFGISQVASVDGATVENGSLVVPMPASEDYVRVAVVIHLRGTALRLN
jgi:glycogen debranching enzyme